MSAWTLVLTVVLGIIFTTVLTILAAAATDAFSHWLVPEPGEERLDDEWAQLLARINSDRKDDTAA